MRRGPKPTPELAQRASRIVQLFTAGHTLQQIGTVYGITRERVRQILKKHGITRTHGGISLACVARKAKKSAALRIRREMRAQELLGCSLEELLAINGGKQAWSRGAPSARYIQQRRSAIARGIGWELTFPQWWAIWQPHYESRGRRGDAFVMARIQDFGPYATWNVHIVTLAENTGEYQAELRKRGVTCADGFKRLPERAAQIERSHA